MQRERQRQSAQGDHTLHHRVHPQRAGAFEARRQVAADQGSRGESAHEGREHRANRGHGVTELQREQARPHDLIEEAGRT